MREIGGYLELENFINNEYYKNLIAFNTARSALKFLIENKKIKKVYIPYYLCDVISKMLNKSNYQFEYYNIDYDFKPLLNKVLDESEYIYIVNYYGQLKDEDIINLNKKYIRIILDNTHSFFQRPLNGIDTIFSCRKFFGVPDGAYLSSTIDKDTNIEIDISKDRMIHLLGRFEGKASDYYSFVNKVEEELVNEPIKYMSKLTHNILRAIDYNDVKRKRYDNFIILCERLNKINNLKISIPDGPFMYPLYIKNAQKIRQRLIENKIYIPILWPNVVKDNCESSLEYIYALNILPIPCDQRYSIIEINYIINKIEEILQENNIEE